MSLAVGSKPRLPHRTRLRGGFKPTVPTRASPAPRLFSSCFCNTEVARNTQVPTTTRAQPSLSLHPGRLCWEQTCLGHLGHLWPGGVGVGHGPGALLRAKQEAVTWGAFSSLT